MAKKNIIARTKLFTPSIVRQIVESQPTVLRKNLAELSASNVSSFKVDPPGTGLKSTQQLNVDWSHFSNHTFFNSAESKVNVAFDTIINYFPFDGREPEAIAYYDALTGYEKWLYDQYPKSVGYLQFSGSDQTAAQAALGPGDAGTYIKVQDFAGSFLSKIAANPTGLPVLDHGTGSFTLDLQLFVPTIANTNQVVLQKLSGSNMGWTLGVTGSTSTQACGLRFIVSSGSTVVSASFSNLQKGVWNRLAAVYDTDNSLAACSLYVTGELLGVTPAEKESEFGNIDFMVSPLLIGSGALHETDSLAWNSTFNPISSFSGAIDELRIYHSVVPIAALSASAHRNVYGTTGSSPHLKLYYKFNEGTGSYTGNDYTIDAGGYGLHSIVTNFKTAFRVTESLTINGIDTVVAPPLNAESFGVNPVLFPAHPDVITYNRNLLYSASMFDTNNPNLITNLVPKHYFLESQYFEGFNSESGSVGDEYSYHEDYPMAGGGKIGAPQIISMMLFTWAKYFDEVKLFLDSFSELSHVSYASSTGSNSSSPDQFLPFYAQQYGFDLPSPFGMANIMQYVAGDDLLPDRQQAIAGLQVVQNQIWRQILVNLPDIIRSKGTIHSIKSLIRSMGINPDNNFRFREFGGSRVNGMADSRLSRSEVATMLKFSGTMAEDSGFVTAVNGAGIPDNKPFLMSPFLSSSRVEVGNPIPLGRGTYHDTISDTWDTPSGWRHLLASASFDRSIKWADAGFHGVSPSGHDGLWTSGSWTYEAIYRFSDLLTGSHPVTQSLMRMHVTGTSLSTKHGIIANLLALSGNIDQKATGSLTLYARPVSDGNTMQLVLTGANIFDGNKWHISCGRWRNDLTGANISDRWFLRVGRQSFDDIAEYYHTGADFNIGTKSGSLLSVTSSYNTYGAFIAIGSQSVNTSTAKCFLNSGSGYDWPDWQTDPKTSELLINKHVSEPIVTEFAGDIAQIRFWSKALDIVEDKEHVRNFKSIGVRDPTVNYSFANTRSGSWERLRLDVSTDQAITRSNALGGITLTDFSQAQILGPGSQQNTGHPGGVAQVYAVTASVPGVNPWRSGTAGAPWVDQSNTGSWPHFNNIDNNLYFHMSGTGFETSTEIIKPETFYYSILSPHYDQNDATNKIRVGAFQHQSNIDLYGGEVAPMSSVPLNKKANDDSRFSIEISTVRALNEDMINIFGTLDEIENAIGNPELVFASTYPSLQAMRDIYFNRLTDKINFKQFFEFFKWFDTSVGMLVEKLVPRNTTFLGVNFVIEPDMLERAKLQYQYSEMYLNEEDSSVLLRTDFNAGLFDMGDLYDAPD